jgi:TatD DNase family protein
MLIDAHTHIAKYEDNIDEVIQEINEHNILTISNSMDVFAYERNLKLAEECKLIIPTFGIHPWTVTENAYKLESLVEFIDKSPMIGEIGLDHHFVAESEKYNIQNQVCEFFLEMAKKQDKVVIIHTKGAEREILDYLKQYDIKRSIIHWYSGPEKLVDQFLELGCYFTIGVEIINSRKIRSLAKKLPADKILTETDNPGAYKWLKDEQGMPSLIQLVVEKLAKVRKLSIEETTQLVKHNLAELMKDDKHITVYHKSLLTAA